MVRLRSQSVCACDGVGDDVGEFDCLVFPEADDGPSSVAELAIGVSVSGLVRFDLAAPPIGVVLWPGAVNRTAVPEATVDVDGDALAREYEIGTAAHSRQGRAVNEEP